MTTLPPSRTVLNAWERQLPAREDQISTLSVWARNSMRRQLCDEPGSTSLWCGDFFVLESFIFRAASVLQDFTPTTVIRALVVTTQFRLDNNDPGFSFDSRLAELIFSLAVSQITREVDFNFTRKDIFDVLQMSPATESLVLAGAYLNEVDALVVREMYPLPGDLRTVDFLEVYLSYLDTLDDPAEPYEEGGQGPYSPASHESPSVLVPAAWSLSKSAASASLFGLQPGPGASSPKASVATHSSVQSIFATRRSLVSSQTSGDSGRRPQQISYNVLTWAQGDDRKKPTLDSLLSVAPKLTTPNAGTPRSPGSPVCLVAHVSFQHRFTPFDVTSNGVLIHLLPLFAASSHAGTRYPPRRRPIAQNIPVSRRPANRTTASIPKKDLNRPGSPYRHESKFERFFATPCRRLFRPSNSQDFSQKLVKPVPPLC
ncbi:hypothetical protein D9611_006282 [Ephemerocybe angulata]|uniref:Uncharacterized protein n=1 Tax=Ephemerocybe angulata TaxID=980116 RepID=A0A8H5FG56_9AGAR|nr:hypothetical protein D9611_006282 [Tulosesus angulatus]